MSCCCSVILVPFPRVSCATCGLTREVGGGRALVWAAGGETLMTGIAARTLCHGQSAGQVPVGKIKNNMLDDHVTIANFWANELKPVNAAKSATRGSLVSCILRDLPIESRCMAGDLSASHCSSTSFKQWFSTCQSIAF